MSVLYNIEHGTSMQTETIKGNKKKRFATNEVTANYNERRSSTRSMRGKTHPHNGKGSRCDLQIFTLLDLQTTAAMYRTLTRHKL